jgi:hypothetical protein
LAEAAMTARHVGQVAAFSATLDPEEMRRLWALGLIATCSNQSTLFGELGAEERRAAAQEILRLSRIPARITKG